MVPLYVLNDADHFKPKKCFSIFENFLKIFSSLRKKSRWEIFEVFLKMVPLYVLNDADHFKPKIIFSIFGQLANWPIIYLIGPFEKVVVKVKVVPLFIANILVKVSSH